MTTHHPADEGHDTRPAEHDNRICNNCWQRRAAPQYDTCTPCFFLPHHHRANHQWAHLIAELDDGKDTTT